MNNNTNAYGCYCGEAPVVKVYFTTNIIIKKYKKLINSNNYLFYYIIYGLLNNKQNRKIKSNLTTYIMKTMFIQLHF